jgi:hypothetical protein
MGPNYVPILDGQEFREFWEDHLTKDARRNIRRAVRRGEGLDDPGLASAAVSLARKYQRISKAGLILYGLVFAFWVWQFVWLMAIPGTGTVSFWRVIAGLWVLMLPIKLGVWFMFQRPRYRQAEKENLQRVEELSQ